MKDEEIIEHLAELHKKAFMQGRLSAQNECIEIANNYLGGTQEGFDIRDLIIEQQKKDRGSL